MAPSCPQCISRLFCPIHSQPLSKLDKLKPFTFYQPLHPVNISKPMSEHSRDEIRALARKHASSSRAESSTSSTPKRPQTASNAVPTSKRQRGPDGATVPPSLELPPTIRATPPTTGSGPARRPRKFACDCWYYAGPCNTKHAPTGVPLEELVAAAMAYQDSRSFDQFRCPDTPYLQCIPCLKAGVWKTWVTGNGGKTTRVRDHLDKLHGEEYWTKCQAEGVVVPRLNIGPGDEDEDDLEYSDKLLHTFLAQWAAVDDQAMNAIEHPEFRRILLLCSRAPRLSDRDIPHRTKLTEMTKELYEEEMLRIRRELKKALGHVCVTTDLWSDDRLRGFLAVTVHYMNSAGELAEHLLAFRRIIGRHTGMNLGQAIHGIFEDAGILDKIGHITLDNASNNDTLMAELERLYAANGQEYSSHAHRIRCFPHVINLAVQALLDGLPDAARHFANESTARGDELDPEIMAYLKALGSEPVGLCRDSVRAMRVTDIRREGLRSTIIEGNQQELFKTEQGALLVLRLVQLLRDCETRWSSTYKMINRYLELFPAVALYAQRNPGMNIPVVSNKQYEVLQDIRSVLSVLHHAQELLSAEQTPTAAYALPVYEALIRALQQCLYKFPELAYAINLAIQKLESYVVKARDLPVYALAMAINPCLKFKWIDDSWGPTRRQQARVEVKEAMLKVRQEMHARGAETPYSQQARSERASQAQNRGYMRLLTLSSDIHRASDIISDTADDSAPEIPSSLPAPSETELLLTHMAEVDAELLRWEEYKWAGSDTMGTINLIEFWKAHRQLFPLLHQVAMNILPVQASSVSSERAFSSSKMTCTRERNNISAENMEYLQVLKHSLHRRRATRENNQTLNFMAHVVGDEYEDSPNI